MIINVVIRETESFPNGVLWWKGKPPTSPSTGDVAYDAVTGRWQLFDGSQWLQVLP